MAGARVGRAAAQGVREVVPKYDKLGLGRGELVDEDGGRGSSWPSERERESSCQVCSSATTNS